MCEVFATRQSIVRPGLMAQTRSGVQRGMALIIMSFLLGLATTAYIIHAINSSTIQTERNKKTFDALAQAKTALIGWSVNHAVLPGMMPFPDRNGDGDYDGKSDCYTGAFAYSFLLGRLPWAGQTNPCITPQTGLGIDIRDGSGERLWYAVSRNLVRDYEHSENPIMNPGMINGPFTTPPYLRQSGTTPYPWMTVLDKSGNVVSNRVAAVIIAPGPPLDNQDRSGGLADATEYLDNFHIGAAIYSNTGYTQPDEDFVMGEDSSAVRSDDTTYQHPYYFNDKLVYITIDELMAEVEKRVAGEAKTALKSYNTTNGYFPYAAPLGSSSGYSCQDTNLSGLLPTGAGGSPTSCSCASASSCTCAFTDISSVSFKRSGTATWAIPPVTVPAGIPNLTAGIPNLCTRTTTQTCSCTGPGYCRNVTATRNFTCTDDGTNTCTNNTTGTYTFSGVFSNASLSTSTGNCSYTCGTSSVTCTGAGTFSSPTCSDPAFGSLLPAWFTANKWQDYLYYQISRSSPTMTVGVKTGIQALLASSDKSITSAPFAASKSSHVPPETSQSRPSCDVRDYLDSVENANADLVFDAPNSPRSNQYNDQVFIVAP